MKILTFLITISFIGAIGSWIAFYFLWTQWNYKWDIETAVAKENKTLSDNLPYLRQEIDEINTKIDELKVLHPNKKK